MVRGNDRPTPDQGAPEATVPSAPLVDSGYRDKVRRARVQPPVDKLLAGFRLFEQGLELTRLDVIRRLGTADPHEVEAALRARFERVRQVRSAGLYRSVAAAGNANS